MQRPVDAALLSWRLIEGGGAAAARGAAGAAAGAGAAGAADAADAVGAATATDAAAVGGGAPRRSARYAAALLRVTNRYDFATLAHVTLACTLELGGRRIASLPPRRLPELHQLCPGRAAEVLLEIEIDDLESEIESELRREIEIEPAEECFLSSTLAPTLTLTLQP